MLLSNKYNPLLVPLLFDGNISFDRIDKWTHNLGKKQVCQGEKMKYSFAVRNKSNSTFDCAKLEFDGRIKT